MNETLPQSLEVWSPPQLVADGLYISELAEVVIEDAARILKMGEPETWEEPRFDGLSKRQSREAYREAVFWFFYDLDPMCERLWSLEWCCQVLGLVADRIREGAVRAGLMPKSIPARS